MLGNRIISNKEIFRGRFKVQCIHSLEMRSILTYGLSNRPSNKLVNSLVIKEIKNIFY